MWAAAVEIVTTRSSLKRIFTCSPLLPSWSRVENWSFYLEGCIEARVFQMCSSWIKIIQKCVIYISRMSITYNWLQLHWLSLSSVIIQKMFQFSFGSLARSTSEKLLCPLQSKRRNLLLSLDKAKGSLLQTFTSENPGYWVSNVIDLCGSSSKINMR